VVRDDRDCFVEPLRASTFPETPFVNKFVRLAKGVDSHRVSVLVHEPTPKIRRATQMEIVPR
jgi:hypothetical protein